MLDFDKAVEQFGRKEKQNSSLVEPQESTFEEKISSFANQVQKQQDSNVEFNYENTKQKNPDTYAEVLRISNEQKLPAKYVEKDLAYLKEKEAKPDFSAIKEKYPMFHALLSRDEDMLALTQDDIDGVTDVWDFFDSALGVDTDAISLKEDVGTATYELGHLNFKKHYQGGLSEEEENYYNTLNLASQKAAEYFDENESLKDLVLLNTAETLGQLSQSVPKQLAGFGVGAGLGAARGSVTGAGALPSALAGGGYGALAATAVDTFLGESGHAVEEFSSIRDVNGELMDVDTAKGAAIAVGLINGGIETISLGAMAKISGFGKISGYFTKKNIKKQLLQNATFRQAAKNFGQAWAGNVAIETTQEVMQEFVNMTLGEIAKMVADGDFEAMSGEEFMQRLTDIAVKTSTGTVLIGGVGASPQLALDTMNAKRAEENKSYFEKMGEKVGNTKLTQRSPAKLKALVEEASKTGAAKEVFVKPEKLIEVLTPEGTTLNQSAVIAEIEKEIPSLKGKIEPALAANNDVVISISDYAASVAGTPLHEALIDDIKLSETGFTYTEAREWERQYEGEFAEEVVRANDEAQKLSESEQPANQVFEEVKQKLIESGQDATVASTNAATWKAFFNTMGSMTGQDAYTLFKTFDIDVQNVQDGQSFKSLLIQTLEGKAKPSASKSDGSAGLDLAGKKSAAVAPPETQAPEATEYVSIFAPPDSVSTNRPNMPPSSTEGVSTNLGSELSFIDPSIANSEENGKPIFQPSNVLEENVNLAEASEDVLINDLQVFASLIDGVEFYGVRTKDLDGLVNKVALRGATPETVTDYLGGRLIVDTAQAMQEVIEKLENSGAIILERDNFLEKGKQGYRAVHYSVRMPNGLAAEIQLVPREISSIQKEMHKLHDKWKEKTEFTKEELAEREKDRAFMQSQFDEAYSHYQQKQATLNQSETAALIDNEAPAELGINLEFAPDPRNESLTDAFNELSPEEKTEATKALSDEIMPELMAELGIDDYTIEFTEGGFGQEVNPSLILRAPAQSFDEMMELAKVAGYVGSQQATIVFDESDQTGTQTGFIKITPTNALTEQERADLYLYLNETVPQVEGYTWRDGSLVIGNFSEWSDNPIDDETLFILVDDALKAYDVDNHFKLQEPVSFRSEYLETTLEGTRYGNNRENEGGRQVDTGRQGRGDVERIDELKQKAEKRLAEKLGVQSQQEINNARWSQGVRALLNSRRSNMQTSSPAPDVLGVILPEIKTINLGNAALKKVVDDHVKKDKDIPIEVIENLREHITDPEFVYRRPVKGKEDEINVVIRPKTAKGESIIVGIHSNGNVKTITPRHDNGTEGRGRQSLLEEVARALGKEGKVYITNKAAQSELEAAQSRPVATIAGGPKRLSKKIVTKDKIVKMVGRELEQSYNDTSNDVVRGNISLPPDIRNGQTIIRMFEAQNLSTFQHESAHFFLEVLRFLANDENATPEVIQQWEAVKSMLGIEGNNETTTEQHEIFARTFEAYLFEGKSPNIELQNIFSRFRIWLVSVYKDIKKLNVTINDEVRSVMDRLLATEEQIEASRQSLNMRALFEDELAANMSKEKFQEYKKAIEEANSEAVRQMEIEVLSEVSREARLWWRETKKKVKVEAEEEINSQKVQQLIYLLMHNKRLGTGEKTDEIKLNREFTEEVLEGTGYTIKDLKGGGPSAMVRKGEGVHPQYIADLFGYSSAQEMLLAIIKAPKRAEAIEQRTDEIMKERHGDVLHDGSIEEKALENIHHEGQARILEIELKSLASRSRTKFTPASVAKKVAQKIIGELKPREIKAGTYLIAERKAARAAEKALIKQNYDEAARQKRIQLINHELYSEAVRAKKDVEKATKYFKKFEKEGTRKKLDRSYLEQIDKILERFEFKQVSNKTLDKRKSLVEWVEAETEKGHIVDISDKLLDEAYKTNIKEMTYLEVVGLRDAIKNIESLARLKQKLLTVQKNRDFDELIDDIENQIIDNYNGAAPVQEKETHLPEDETSNILTQFVVGHRKLSSIIREMSGFKDGGILWETIVRSANEREDTETVMKQEAGEKLAKLFDLLDAKIPVKTPFFKNVLARGKKIKNVNLEVGSGQKLYKKVYYPELGESLTKMAVLVIALNQGNQGNKEKLIAGYRQSGWTQEKIDALLNKAMTEKDWQFVQGVWDFINAYWPASSEKQYRITGVRPEKVEAAPVQTPYGEMRGGYFPIKYDSRQDNKAYKDVKADIAKQMLQGAVGRSTTKRGYTKTRVEGVERPIRLDFGGIFEHTSEIIHDQIYHEWLIDMHKIIDDKRFAGTVKKYYGFEKYKAIKETIDDIAAGDVPATQAWERAVNYLRQGSSIAYMGWSVWTSMLQPLGLTQSTVRIGPKWVAKGLGRFMASAVTMEGTVEWIYSQSSFMKNRSTTLNREINEIRNQIAPKGAAPIIKDSFFYLLVKAQLIADIPTWLGQYEKMKAEGRSDKDAAALADQAVIDAQGSGGIKDMAALQRGGPLQKMWTNFYSYFNVTFNLTAESFNKANFKKPADIGRFMVDITLLYTVPSVMATMMYEATRGDCEDMECVAKSAVGDLAGYTLGTMLGLRELSGIASGFGYTGPSGTNLFAEASKLAVQAGQGEIDEAFLKSLNKTGGLMFHYPAAQLERTARGFMALAEGDTSNPFALLTGPAKRDVD